HTRSKRDWSSDVCSSDLKKLFHFFNPLFYHLAQQLDQLLGFFRFSLTHILGHAGPDMLAQQFPAESCEGSLDGGHLVEDIHTVRSEERRVGKGCKRRGRA